MNQDVSWAGGLRVAKVGWVVGVNRESGCAKKRGSWKGGLQGSNSG